MGDMKEKFKGLMKKVNKSSSSGRFSGQGRVLGSSSSLGPTNPVPLSARWAPQSAAPPVSSSNPKSFPQKPLDLDNNHRVEDKPFARPSSGPNEKKTNEFDSYEPLITSSRRNNNGYEMNVFECPVCGQGFRSQDEVSHHVDSCLDSSKSSNENVESDMGENNNVVSGVNSELDERVGVYLSGNPSNGFVDILLRLLRNVAKEPDNAKFRRVRLGNPKIKEAIGDVTGGVELLECVGFVLREEEGEMWAVMEEPSEEEILIIKKAISLLEQSKVKELVSATAPSTKVEESVSTACLDVPDKVDRQIRVFFSVPERVAAKIELPDSFYNLSAEEVRREADARRKKMAESQLLIPKSYREKQAKALKKKYRRTVIRVQFPDGVVLQGVFSPREPTIALYEFVSTALKDSSLEFELLNPAATKRRVIPRFSVAGQKAFTLEEEDMVPSALIKFKPFETDSVVFMGLCNELLEISEPFDSAVALR